MSQRLFPKDHPFVVLLLRDPFQVSLWSSAPVWAHAGGVTPFEKFRRTCETRTSGAVPLDQFLLGNDRALPDGCNTDERTAQTLRPGGGDPRAGDLGQGSLDGSHPTPGVFSTSRGKWRMRHLSGLGGLGIWMYLGF